MKISLTQRDLKKETKKRDLPRARSSNETDVPPNGFNDLVAVAFVNQTRKQLQADKIQTRDRDVGSCVKHCCPKQLDNHEELASPLKPLLDGFPRSTAGFAVAALDVVGHVVMSEDQVNETFLLRLGIPR